MRSVHNHRPSELDGKRRQCHGYGCCGYKDGQRVSVGNYNATVGQLPYTFANEASDPSPLTNRPSTKVSDSQPPNRKPSPDSSLASKEKPGTHTHSAITNKTSSRNKSQLDYSIHVSRQAADDAGDEERGARNGACDACASPSRSFVPAMCHRGGGGSRDKNAWNLMRVAILNAEPLRFRCLSDGSR
ncbi:hypothetical protein NPIL_180811 [Nephila pilipes]|uniref:Uncharacterized protein n=1 Tax=Nephila pilipes TaxID=299642 RepID=A0A8X6N3H8_NEPPI|nr:hypothetical protein NPIL_180811 [Nephila pilipes]